LTVNVSPTPGSIQPRLNSVVFSGPTAAPTTIAFTEANYAGNFAVSAPTPAGIFSASIVNAGGTGTLTLGPTAAGSGTSNVTDTNGQSVLVNVTVNPTPGPLLVSPNPVVFSSLTAPSQTLTITDPYNTSAITASPTPVGQVSAGAVTVTNSGLATSGGTFVAAPVASGTPAIIVSDGTRSTSVAVTVNNPAVSPGSITASPNPVVFTAAAGVPTPVTVTLSETGYSGVFNLTDTSPIVSNSSPQPTIGNTFQVTPISGGSESINVDNSPGGGTQTLTIPVTVNVPAAVYSNATPWPNPTALAPVAWTAPTPGVYTILAQVQCGTVSATPNPAGNDILNIGNTNGDLDLDGGLCNSTAASPAPNPQNVATGTHIYTNSGGLQSQPTNSLINGAMGQQYVLAATNNGQFLTYWACLSNGSTVGACSSAPTVAAALTTYAGGTSYIGGFEDPFTNISRLCTCYIWNVQVFPTALLWPSNNTAATGAMQTWVTANYATPLPYVVPTTSPTNAPTPTPSPLYGSNVLATSTPTTASRFSNVTGGTETSATTTVNSGISSSLTYSEIYSQGNGGVGAFSAIPAPDGRGWSYVPGAGTFAAGNWSANANININGITGETVTMRVFKYSGGTYTQMGSNIVTAGSNYVANTKTVYSFGATNFTSAYTFGATDVLYIDLWAYDSGGAGADTQQIYESNSAAAGVANDVAVSTSAFLPTSQVGPLVLSPTSITFTSPTSAPQTIAITDTQHTGSFTLSASNPTGVATGSVTGTNNSGTITISPATGASYGTATTFQVGDGTNTVNLPVSIAAGSTPNPNATPIAIIPQPYAGENATPAPLTTVIPLPATGPFTVIAQVKCGGGTHTINSAGNTIFNLGAGSAYGEAGLCNYPTANGTGPTSAHAYTNTTAEADAPNSLTAGTSYVIAITDDGATALNYYTCTFPLSTCTVGYHQETTNVTFTPGSTTYIGESAAATRVASADIWNFQVYNYVPSAVNTAAPNSMATFLAALPTSTPTADPYMSPGAPPTSGPTGGGNVSCSPQGTQLYPVFSACFTANTPFHHTIAALKAAGIATPDASSAAMVASVMGSVGQPGINSTGGGNGANWLGIAGQTSYPPSNCTTYTIPVTGGTSTCTTVLLPTTTVLETGYDKHNNSTMPSKSAEWDAYSCSSGATCSASGFYPYSGPGFALNPGLSNAAGFAVGLYAISAQDILNFVNSGGTQHIGHALEIQTRYCSGNGSNAASYWPSAFRNCDSLLSGQNYPYYGEILHMTSNPATTALFTTGACSFNTNPVCNAMAWALYDFGAYLGDTNCNGATGCSNVNSINYEYPTQYSTASTAQGYASGANPWGTVPSGFGSSIQTYANSAGDLGSLTSASFEILKLSASLNTTPSGFTTTNPAKCSTTNGYWSGTGTPNC
jgi:hypothetical protein